MRNARYWEGRRILVTGGTAGLGRELALHAAAAGASVAVVGRNRARLEQLRADARARGLVVQAIEADVADKQAVYRIAADAVAALGGGIDVLVNNASYLGDTPLRLLVDSDCEDLEKALATNVVGPFRLIKAVLPAMLLGGQGLVVNISSDAAVGAYEAWGAYGTSKAALDHLSRIFDAELARRGVRFVAVDPGDMATAMHFAAIPAADAANLRRPEDVARELLGFLPLVREVEGVRFSASAWREIGEVGHA